MDEQNEEVQGFATLEELIEKEVKPFIEDQQMLWDMTMLAGMPMSQRGLMAYQLAHMDVQLLPAELRASSLDAVAKLYGAALGLPIPE